MSSESLYGDMPVVTLAFAPAIPRLAVEVHPGLKVIDLPSMTAVDSFGVATPKDWQTRVSYVAYTGAGNVLVALTTAGTLHGVDLRRDIELWRADLGPAWPSILVTSYRTAQFAAAFPRDGLVIVGSTFDGTVSCRLKAQASIAAYSPDGTRLLLLNGRTARIVDTRNCETATVAVPPGIGLYAGAWFDARCRHAVIAMRFRRRLEVLEIPESFRCK